MKKFLRTIHEDNFNIREEIKDKLNSIGFYVINGVGESIDVYAIESTNTSFVGWLLGR